MRCPTDLLILNQQQTNNNFYHTARHLIKTKGFAYLFTGFFATATRSGMFATAFLAVHPIMKSTFQQYYPNEVLTSFTAGIIAGASAATVTQGLDTLSVAQQTHVSEKSLGILEAAKKIYSRNGFYGFFKGGIPRGTRAISAVIIMSSVNEKLSILLQENKLKLF